MKQISDKVNLAVRSCKGKEKKITAAELEILNILTNLSNLMKVITYFVNLEILLLIYSQEKMIYLQ